MRSAFKLAFFHSLPVLTGYLFLGIGFGVLMNKAGFAWWLMQSLSLFVFAGALQYAAVAILANGFNPLTTFLLAFMINLRHIFYGLSMLKNYHGLGFKRFFLIFGLTDETFSINASLDRSTLDQPDWYYFFVTGLNYIYWNIAGSIGFWLADFVPDTLKGSDFVLTALFYVMFLNQWRQVKGRSSLMLGLGVSLISLFIVGSTHFLWFSMLIISGVLMFSYLKGVHHATL